MNGTEAMEIPAGTPAPAGGREAATPAVERQNRGRHKGGLALVSDRLGVAAGPLPVVPLPVALAGSERAPTGLVVLFYEH
jgi:hypothetical protein